MQLCFLGASAHTCFSAVVGNGEGGVVMTSVPPRHTVSSIVKIRSLPAAASAFLLRAPGVCLRVWAWSPMQS